jgi:ABC-type multidrug transport system ATPase subunit
MDRSFVNRPVNEGFSGGEKKRNEILQMAVLEPKLAILDETDSGLDIDALKTVAQGVNRLRRPDNAMILVTHYQRLLQYVEPDHVHVLFDGHIVKSGGKELALELERKGYDWIREEVPAGEPAGGAWRHDHHRHRQDRYSRGSGLSAGRLPSLSWPRHSAPSHRRFASRGSTTPDEDWRYTNLTSLAATPPTDCRRRPASGRGARAPGAARCGVCASSSTAATASSRWRGRPRRGQVASLAGRCH